MFRSRVSGLVVGRAEGFLFAPARRSGGKHFPGRVLRLQSGTRCKASARTHGLELHLSSQVTCLQSVSDVLHDKLVSQAATCAVRPVTELLF